MLKVIVIEIRYQNLIFFLFTIGSYSLSHFPLCTWERVSDCQLILHMHIIQTPESVAAVVELEHALDRLNQKVIFQVCYLLSHERLNTLKSHPIRIWIFFRERVGYYDNCRDNLTIRKWYSEFEYMKIIVNEVSHQNEVWNNSYSDMHKLNSILVIRRSKGAHFKKISRKVKYYILFDLLLNLVSAWSI